MISHHHQCIFVHIPKAGGQSVEMAFLKNLGLSWDNRDQLLLRSSEQPGHPSSLAHLKAKEYVGLGFIEQPLFDSYFKFAIVRNPWARMVSSYHYLGYARNTSFNNFVTKTLPEPSQIKQGLHMSPQVDYLRDNEGHSLVDFVGRLENIDADFATVCQQPRLGDLQLEHVNKTKYIGATSSPAVETLKALLRLKLSTAMTLKNTKSHYRDYYNAKSRAVIEKNYAEDIQTFGYKF